MAIDTTKPFIIALLVLAIGGTVAFLAKPFAASIWKGNLFENTDLLRQKMAPAFNETTGFLLVSYVVILCIGNVIMKTSPKYLTKFSEESVKTKKVKGVVSSLQQSNMSWLPFMIASIGIAIASFIPFEDKKLKIIIIGIILIVSIIIALIFNEISNLFRKKESFTNVKEEFGHLDSKGKPHGLTITIKVEPQDDKNQPDVIKHDIQAGGTPEYPHTSTKGDMKIAHDGSGGIGSSWNIPVNTESLTNTVTLKKSTEGGVKRVTNKYRIFITDVPFYHPDADTKHNIRELFSKDSLKNPSTDMNKHYEEAGYLNITATAATTNLYFHAIKKELFHEQTTSDDGIIEYKYPSSLDRPGYNAKSNDADEKKFPKAQLNHFQLDLYEKTAMFNKNNSAKKQAYEAASKLAEQHRETESRELYEFLKGLSGNNYDKPNNKDGEAYRMVHHIEGQDYTNNGMRISLQNNEQFFGFDVKAVKDSVRASYISYYCLVWGSLLVYTIVNAIQTGKRAFKIPIHIPKSLLPFLVAAAVETLLIGQSHYSLDESDIGDFGKASPTFNYAVAGFATRIATVVAFLSYIIMKVKD